MKRFFISFFTLLSAIGVAAAGDGLPFQAGERLSYSCQYRLSGIKGNIATCHASVDEADAGGGAGAFDIKVNLRTSGMFDTFFKVRDALSCRLTSDKLIPLSYVRETNEGDYHAHDEYSYMWGADKPYIKAKLSSTSNGTREVNIPLSDNTFDLLTLFFRLRNFNLSGADEGSSRMLSFVFDQKSSRVRMTYYGQETLKIKGLGNVKALKFGVNLKEVASGDGNKGGSDMYLWLSDDENRVPLLFEVPIRVGSVSGYLSSYQGLKHPFGAGR